MYEKWEELEHQFRAETQQQEPPFGPGVIEWDYSRYTRALGFGKSPGLDSLPRRGCVVVSGRPDFWDATADHLEQWSESIGWDVLRVSARPSTVVPDPTIYHLGIEITHPDSLIFCGAGQQGEPALGKRPRSPAMRIPLSATERWLIAADRVRRRLRTEVATRGIVIYIDEAHLLTPNALSILCYLMDAQCAWRSHLLSTPAQVYIALAIPASADEWFRETLTRFSPLSSPFLAREPEGPRTLRDIRHHPHITAEEEHVLAVLGDLGVDVPMEQLRRWFGAAAVESAMDLSQPGSIQIRNLQGVTTLGARREAVGAKASTRAMIHAVRSCSRVSRAEGRRHLGSVLSVCELRLARIPRFRARCAGIGAQEAALTPLEAAHVMIDELVATECDQAPRVLCALFCLAAQVRDFSVARRTFRRLSGMEDLRVSDLSSIVTNALQIGHFLTIECIDDSAWPRLGQRSGDPTLVDTYAILADTFVRMAVLDRKGVEDRHRSLRALVPASVEALGAERSSTSAARARRMILALAARLDTYVSARPSPGDNTQRNSLVGGPIPIADIAVPSAAYVLGSVASLRRVFVECSPSDPLSTDYAFIRDCLVTAGYPGNVVHHTIQLGYSMNRAGLRLLSNTLVDEVALLGQFMRPLFRKQCVARLALATTPARLAQMALQHCAQSTGLSPRGSGQTWDKLATAAGLLRAGWADMVVECTRFAAEEEPCDDKSVLFLVGCSAALRASSPELESEVRSRIASRRPADWRSCARPEDLILVGIELIMDRRWAEASAALECAQVAVSRRTQGDQAMLFEIATGLVRAVRIARRVASTPVASGASRSTKRYRRRLSRAATLPDEAHGPQSEPFVVMAMLDRIARSWSRDDRNPLLELGVAAARFLAARWKWTVPASVAAFERQAPAFYGVLRAAMDDLGCMLPAAGPSSSSVSIALATVLASRGGAPRSTISQVRLARGWGRRKAARLAGSSLGEDGAAFAWAMRSAWPNGAEPELRRAGRIGSRHHWSITRKYDTKWVGNSERGTLSIEESDDTGPVSVSRLVGRSVRGGERPLPVPPHGSRTDTSAPRSVGRSPAFVALIEQVEAAASCGHPVLIVGETGSGKELVARQVHEQSARGRAQIVSTNCGAVPDTLVERELFGHRRGAFSGADADLSGVVNEAAGGTLFLDEIDSASPRMQATLLRVLDSGEYRRLGDSATRKADFRLLVAALPRLRGQIELGVFRQDLYYRISTLVIEVPPLRERGEDVGLLARAFAGPINVQVMPDAISALEQHAWPGNVRELRHAIMAMSIRCNDRTIGADDVRRWLDGHSTSHESVGLTCWEPDGDADRRAETPCDLAIDTLQARGIFSSADVARIARVSRRTAQRELARWVDRGKLARYGAGRATRYERMSDS